MDGNTVAEGDRETTDVVEATAVPEGSGTQTKDGAAEMAATIGGLWNSLSSVSSDLDTVVGRVKSHVDQFADLRRAAEEMASTNAGIGTAATDAEALSQQVIREAEESQSSLRQALDDIHGLVGAVNKIEQFLSGLSTALSQVSNVSNEIEAIARQTRLLALNATIEAARAGEAGKGFGVVAGEVKALAQQTSNATAHIEETVSELAAIITQLTQESTESLTRAGSVETSTNKLGDVMQGLRDEISAMGERVSSISKKADVNEESCRSVVASLNGLTSQVEKESAHLEEASERTAKVMWDTQAVVETAMTAGYMTPDTPFLDIVREGARRVTEAFNAALEAGETRESDLFDEAYRPVPGTNPEQVLTRFTELTDTLLPAIQEELLGRNGKILFCAAVDRNGYLPTHNKKYAHPQGPDPVWNAANCRNRRIFNDPTGLTAARNTKPFALTSYRRDMGGGNFVMCKDISCPIFIGGRHWGGFRMGYLL